MSRISAPNPDSRSSIQLVPKLQTLGRWELTIKFADGTNIEIAATAYNDFVKHDLKWAEFVHGRATVKKLACKDDPCKLVPAVNRSRSVHPCPAGGC